ncbi:LOW QUALITY PROTEIN: putative N-acetyltransferase 16 [Rhynchonycteris naso]
MQVLTLEKEAEPDAEPCSESPPQETRAKSKSGSGLEADAEPLGAESGTEAKAKFLGAKPRSGSGSDTKAEELDFVVATEREFEERLLTISWGINGGLNYLPSCYHSWLWDPNHTVVLAKCKGGVIALESVHMIDIDIGKIVLVEGLCLVPWEFGKGVAGLLQFCSQLVPGWGVGRVRGVNGRYSLPGDDQLGPRELKKYRLITKQGILLIQFNALALLAGLGTRLVVLRPLGTFSPLPTKAAETGGDVASLLLSSSVHPDVLPGKIIIQDWQPYQPSESHPLLAAKSLEWRVSCPRLFPIPHGGDSTWCYLNIDAFCCNCAQVQSQLLRNIQRQAQRLAGLNIMGQLFLAPQLWSQLAYFCQAGYTEQYMLEANI